MRKPDSQIKKGEKKQNRHSPLKVRKMPNELAIFKKRTQDIATMRLCLGGIATNDSNSAETTCRADGDNSVLLLGTAQLVDSGSHHTPTGGGEGVANRDGASVNLWVGLVGKVVKRVDWLGVF